MPPQAAPKPKGNAPSPATPGTPAPHKVAPMAPRPAGAPRQEARQALVWIALSLAVLPALGELMYLAFGDGRWDPGDTLFVPTLALVLPIVAGTMAAVLLSGRRGDLDQGARNAAMIALILAVAVVATWGLWILMAMLVLMSVTPSPQPCNVTCQNSSSQTCCSCGHDGGCCNGCCGGGSQDCCSGACGCGSCCSASGSGSGSCCNCNGSSSGSGGGSCCGSSSSGSSGGGSCCGSSSGSGSSSGGCGCGSSSGSGSRGAPAGGFAAVASGLAGGLALHRIAWRDRLAHHPDTPAYRQDVLRVAGLRLCIGCFVTFPLFAILTPTFSSLALPGPWWAPVALGLGLAGLQGISAAGLAKRRWQKVLVKASLGTGLALAVAGIRAAPILPVAQGASLLALAGLAYASTIPRRRRMARDAARA